MYINNVGGVVVVTELYVVVWAKSKEQKAMMSDESPQKISQQGHQQLPITVPKIDVSDDNKPQLVIVEDQTKTEKQ
jgi:hypothetical protein